MSDWTAGYVADIGYTYGYYGELNPLRVKLAFLNSGLVFPEFGTACELGFGQGMSTNFHAAATITQWHGTDFNPAQAGFAQELAAASGSGAKLYDEAFNEFANRTDLPDFDYIGLHGIWSWISDENRHVIVDFIRRKLKIGGVLYISYNTLPGLASFAPMRHLMTAHAEIFGPEGNGIVSRIDGALEFTEKLLATNPLYLRANPLVGERVTKIKDQNRDYLAHEYFNRDWHPMHFASMANWLETAKVQYACSAHYLDHIDGINLTPEQQEFLKTIIDPSFKESVRDFMVNQHFRRDYWVKGVRKLNPLEQLESWRRQKVILLTYRPDVSLKVTGALGEATMTEEIYAPILDALADHKPRTLGQLEQLVRGKNINFAQLTQAISVLIGGGNVAPVQEDSVIGKGRKHTEKLNSHLIAKARNGGELTFLASPVIGGGVHVPRFQQLFLLAMSLGKKQPSEWAEFVGQILEAQNQRIIKNGKMVDSEADNIKELLEQANDFAEKQLPVLRVLQIA